MDPATLALMVVIGSMIWVPLIAVSAIVWFAQKDDDK